MCFLHPFLKPSVYSPGLRALGRCCVLSQCSRCSDSMMYSLANAVQVINVTRNAEIRYFQCASGLSCAWPNSQWWLASLVWQGICYFFSTCPMKCVLRITQSDQSKSQPLIYKTAANSPRGLLSHSESILSQYPWCIRNICFQKYLIMILPRALPCLLLREVLRFRKWIPLWY